MCAIRLAGCSPSDLIEHEAEEARDEAEGVRVAYVAATRARDLLVVPAVGDEEREGWIEPLNAAIYPPETRRSRRRRRGALIQDEGLGADPAKRSASPETVSPGLHVCKGTTPNGPEYSLVSWVR